MKLIADDDAQNSKDLLRTMCFLSFEQIVHRL